MKSTPELHLLRLVVDLPALNRLAEERRLMHHNVLDEGLVLHHLLAETFGKGVVQPFRLMPARGARTATLYGYSRLDEQALRGQAELHAMPEVAQILSIDRLAAKGLPLRSLHVGRRLGFDVRIRPVVRARAGDGLRNAGAERDVFQHEAEKTFPNQRGALAQSGRKRLQVYRDWLQQRLEGAAQLDVATVRLAHFRRSRIIRNKHVIEGPDAVLHGVLTIEDVHAFIGLLEKGVGRHRAYGYGMLLLRPATEARG